MEIKDMNLAEVVERLASLETEVREMTEVEAVEKATEEKKALLERKAELENLEQRKAQAEALASGEIEPDAVVEVVKVETEERSNMEKKYGTDSAEYREAFFANLVGKATVEQRSIFADNTTAGDGIALPVAVDEAIWDQILTAHPILNDVSIVKSGVVMKVPQATPSNLSTAGKGKKDSDAIVALTFTMVDKILAGKDYTTYVTLSYAEAKMSQGAMEAFLVNEIANILGEQLAADVFASIKADGAAITKGTSYFEDIHKALAGATQATSPVIYAKAADYYGILSEVDANGQPIVREGVVLGAALKLDNAASDITVVDPKQFILNVIADTSITSQEVVSKGGYDIGGYMRAEGCLRKTLAGAVIA